MTKVYLTVSGLFFTLVAVLHLFRLIYKVPVQVGDWLVPLWMSVGGFILPGLLAVGAVKIIMGINRTKKD